MKCSLLSSISLVCVFQIWHLSPISLFPFSYSLWGAISNTWTITTLPTCFPDFSPFESWEIFPSSFPITVTKSIIFPHSIVLHCSQAALRSKQRLFLCCIEAESNNSFVLLHQPPLVEQTLPTPDRTGRAMGNLKGLDVPLSFCVLKGVVSAGIDISCSRCADRQQQKVTSMMVHKHPLRLVLAAYVIPSLSWCTLLFSGTW